MNSKVCFLDLATVEGSLRNLSYTSIVETPKILAIFNLISGGEFGVKTKEDFSKLMDCPLTKEYSWSRSWITLALPPL